MENKETEKKKEKKELKLEELVKNITDENRHEEMFTDIQGKEII